MKDFKIPENQLLVKSHGCGIYSAEIVPSQDTQISQSQARTLEFEFIQRCNSSGIPSIQRVIIDPNKHYCGFIMSGEGLMPSVMEKDQTGGEILDKMDLIADYHNYVAFKDRIKMLRDALLAIP